jgi:hypothetical protein
MTDDLKRIHEMLWGLFAVLPPAVFVGVSVVVLGLAVWTARHALHSHRIAQAIDQAPLVDLRSNVQGLVKLRGVTQPPTPRPGAAPSAIVWYSSSQHSHGNRSTRTSIDHFVIRDEHAACAVDALQTTILGSRSDTSEGFLDKSRWSTEKTLFTGDAVFALGALRRDLPPLAGVPDARVQLVRIDGVLLVSGESERQTQVLYRLWFIVQAPLAMLCFGLLAFGGWAHVMSYPPGARGQVATFYDSLLATPWKSEAGPDHPLWPPAQAEPEGNTPRTD